jgi:hypothetical protein
MVGIHIPHLLWKMQTNAEIALPTEVGFLRIIHVLASNFFGHLS